jgi:hypothetical protein
MNARLITLGFASVLLAACGSEPPPKAPEVVKDDAPPPQRQLKMQSELGTVDPDAVKRAFHQLDDQFTACQTQGMQRVGVLAGSLQFFLRIGADGTMKWAYLEQSDLGDRDTERCLLDAVMNAQWPRPDGGDAEARTSLELQGTGRPATDWSSDKVAAALGKAGNALDQCTSGTSGFKGTLYVGPGGKVLAAGVAVSSKDGASKADCVAKVLGKMKGLPSPGSWPAKVTFGL